MNVSACSAVCAFVVASVLGAGCGKKGPPLPPLIRVPVAPADLTAERRSDRVDLQFTVPAANTDNSRPANIERVDVYAFTGPTTITDAELLKRATRVASLSVKAPRDPDATVDPDEGDSESDVEPPTGKGLDQGARAHVDEKVSLVAPSGAGQNSNEPASSPAPTGSAGEPPAGGSAADEARTYVAVGITTRGKRGAMSKRIVVPLVPAPPAPTEPLATYSETAVELTWKAPSAEPTHADAEPAAKPADASAAPGIGFNVYEVPSSSASKPGPAETRLTKTPVAETHFDDPRIEWGTERCYEVRTVRTAGGVPIESEPTRPVCVTPVDKFPPAAPKGLTAVATEGAISLIWDPNAEKDLAGYIVLRGTPGEELKPITSAPITETTFKDTGQPGSRYVYAVEAVDKAGNISAPSNKVEETAR